MRAFITGITGFAGFHLAEHLLACGDEVLGCSTTGVWPTAVPRELTLSAEAIAWDISRDDGLSDAARRRIASFAPTSLYHLAAVSVPDLCGEGEPTPAAREVNVAGTRRVFELARSLSPPPRVLYVSSSHVYAPVAFEHNLVSEDAPLGPRRGYGITKLAAEQLACQAADEGLDVLIARAFQHAGPRQGPRMMLSEWISQLAADDDSPVRVRTLDAYPAQRRRFGAGAQPARPTPDNR
jgi:GDP-4-dehydro-6-deoxy-D-mannose reductase